MARHRALTCDNAARNKEDRRDGATLSARTDAVSLNVTDRREGATLGARTNAVPLNKDEERRRIAALGAYADAVPLKNRVFRFPDPLDRTPDATARQEAADRRADDAHRVLEGGTSSLFGAAANNSPTNALMTV